VSPAVYSVAPLRRRRGGSSHRLARNVCLCGGRSGVSRNVLENKVFGKKRIKRGGERRGARRAETILFTSQSKDRQYFVWFSSSPTHRWCTHRIRSFSALIELRGLTCRWAQRIRGKMASDGHGDNESTACSIVLKVLSSDLCGAKSRT
jgi:hypothetical protein